MAAAYAWPDREMKKEREIIYCTPQSAVVLLITLGIGLQLYVFFWCSWVHIHAFYYKTAGLVKMCLACKSVFDQFDSTFVFRREKRRNTLSSSSPNISTEQSRCSRRLSQHTTLYNTRTSNACKESHLFAWVFF